MKAKIAIVTTLVFLFIWPMMLSAQTYDNLWVEVEKAEQSGLPKTAIKHTEAIFRKAEAEKNSAQMLRAYTARSTYRQQVAPDSFYVDLKGLEQWAATTADPKDCAVLHTLIARIYGGYAYDNQWNLHVGTEVVDTPADDIREWSRNMFVQKVLDHTHAALEDSVLLSALSSAEYVPFVTQQPTSRYYNHNMYQLLSAYGIAALRQVAFDNDPVVSGAIAEIYARLNRMYTRQDNADALVLLALDGLEWRRADGGISMHAYQMQIDGLIGRYAGREIIVEACLAKIRNLVEQDRKVEAYRVCRETLSKYPKYERIDAVKELQEEILRPDLCVNMDARVYPGEPLSIGATHANLDGFTVNYYRVNLPVTSPLLQKALDDNFLKAHTRKVRTEHFSLTRPADYLPADTVYTSVTPQEGFYAVQVVPDDRTAKAVSQWLSVSSLKLLFRGLPDEQLEAVVLDARSGQPVTGVTVHLFTGNWGEWTLDRSVETRADGRAEIPWNDGYRYIAAADGSGSVVLPEHVYRGYLSFPSGKRTESRNLTLLTDRSIYRPGQTVYVKGIAYSQLSDTAGVIAGGNYTLILRDANNREVARKMLTTNAFGSFSTEFVLPEGGLNGLYTLREERGASVVIRVEEYKRPTFEVTLDGQDGTFRPGDSVWVNGTAKTYSGVPIQEQAVRYVVTRRVSGWWGWPYGTDITTGSGTVTTAGDGTFTLPVLLKPGDGPDASRGYYTFTVSATVTNAAGETQTSTTVFTAGHRSLLLGANVPERIDKAADVRLTFSATNLSRRPVAVTGEYTLYRFTDYAKKTLARAPACTGTFTSNTETLLPEWKYLPTGRYKLTLTATDEQGRRADYETETILFSIHDNRPVEDIGLWYHPLNEEFDDAHPGEFLFGTSHKDAHVLMDVFSGSKRLESRTLHLSDSVMRFTYPYRAEYGDGLTVTFCYVKDGEAYTQDVGLRKRIPEKELKLSWAVFRDKLRPGQQEEWKLTIRNPDGSFADAELLATLYDASLDRIWKRSQRLTVGYPLCLPSVYWRIYPNDRFNYYYFGFDRKTRKYPELAYDAFRRMPPFTNQEIYYSLDEVVSVAYATPRASRSEGIMIRGLAKAEAVDRTMDFAPVEEVVATLPSPEAESMPAATGDLRTHFAETAFFYPQLRTNAAGEAVIAFTLPESLTRWNFNGYAHTKGMLTGSISSEVVASKEFMLTPNLPRFVRVGDHTSVAATVANLTVTNLTGNVTLTLFDPLTGKVISTQKQRFTTEAGKTAGVNFTFTATDRYELLGCRLVAEGGTFSDGEQHLLPVLSNRERVVETVPMPVRGKQTREFPLEKLFNNNSKTVTNRSLTVEFSGNLAWYAVQALPSLSLPTDDNAISWATAYYANALASYIMNSQPRLKAVFDAWKQQGGTKETFMSNLQKNRDVKNILLEESPWVMEATSEQERKERIATLFDLNNLRNNNITALNKLKDLQLSSGAWTWYKGMPGSRYVTHFVTQSLVRLSMLTGKALEGDALAMRRRAFTYLHREALDEYNDIRKGSDTGRSNFHAESRLSSNALHYLYLVLISGETVPKANQAAYNYFLNRIKETIAAQSITEKAMAAVILRKADRTTDAQAFIASLKEYATQTDEQGMFFAFNEDPYSWAGLKVPAHVSVMEAFDGTGADMDAVEEMKLWLLKEKQTQQWNSPVSTVNAVYALLFRGASLTDNQGDVRITLGDKVIKTRPERLASSGIAYVKETFTDPQTINEVKKAVVEKRDAGIAWGAVYAQYEEEMDKVTSHGEGLHIDKKLYVERITGTKKELLPITGTPLKTGDKVVSRITIKVDRAMDFVQLKDQRAACFEPVGNLSGYTYGAGTGYYVAVKDASTNFYFDALGKGVYVLEHSYRVSRSGTYESGLATIQSAYAPEYASHASSVKVICQ